MRSEKATSGQTYLRRKEKTIKGFENWIMERTKAGNEGIL
jgi:hypothetical protein